MVTSARTYIQCFDDTGLLENISLLWDRLIGMSGESVFSKVTLRAERERVFARIADERAVFSIQIKKKNLQCRAYARKGRYLVFDLIENGPISASESSIVSFWLTPEVYFMKTKVFDPGGEWSLDLGGDLYKLQRRDNFRFVIPTRYKAQFAVQNLELPRPRQSFQIVDLSGGGLSFETNLPKDVFRSGQNILGVIRISGKDIKAVEGVIKHVRTFGSMGSGLLRVGVQFENLGIGEREELISLVLKMHRESFAKFRVT